MEGKTLMKRLRELGVELPDEFAAFPVVLLDEVAVIWASKGVTIYWPTTKGQDQERGALS